MFFRWSYFALFILTDVCEAITKQEFFGYPFDTVNGDLPKKNDDVSYITLNNVFPFLGKKYRGMQVSAIASVRMTQAILIFYVYRYRVPRTLSIRGHFAENRM